MTKDLRSLRQEVIASATAAQHAAADPMSSVWVSANAGTGKTRVLTNRILRLLLGGARAADILAVTYTRAAAAEMRNRLYERLSKWAVVPESELTDSIRLVGVERPSQKEIARARQLFTLLLDDPVGLRIETVHAFAQSVLRRFPIEAGIQPYFDLATTNQTKTLRMEVADEVMRSADPVITAALARLAEDIGQDQMMSLTKDIFEYAEFMEVLARDPVRIKRGLFVALEVPEAADDPAKAIDELRQEITKLGRGRKEQLQYFAAALETGTDKEKEKAGRLRAWMEMDDEAREAAFEDISMFFLTKTDFLPLKNQATKAVRNAFADAVLFAEREAHRLVDVFSRINAIQTAERSFPLLLVAEAMSRGYRKRKLHAGLMDYNDLITDTVRLLEADGGAAWVRYKLDEGISHILIDEAQDTSPSQWRILSRLAAEFFTGDEDIPKDQPGRSLFSVGDYKQSIYSFQGAEPDLFHDQEVTFQGRAAQARKPFRRVDLDTSFRSAGPVLQLVDQVIGASTLPAHEDNSGEDAARQPGLPGLGQAARHGISRIGESGFVTLLDPVTSDEEAGNSPPELVMARQIVEVLKSWIGKRFLPARGRMMRPEDILILVRKRRGFAQILDREIRLAGLPMAGADRVRLRDDIAVMDLIALGRVMLLPEDDLTLAAVLKSPVFGLGEEHIFRLAHDRGEARLFQRLAALAQENEEFDAAHEKLLALMGKAESFRPYEFYRAVLDKDTRKAFATRLGAHVMDVLAEFLDAARQHEKLHSPSLLGFIETMETTDDEVSRESLTRGSNEIRMMTIHGAKGLEAPVIVLPDTLRDRHIAGQIVTISHEGVDFPVLPARTGRLSSIIEAAIEAKKQKAEEEENRLLYVALTRAEDGLLIAGYEAKSRRMMEGSWYEKIAAAMSELKPGPCIEAGLSGVTLTSSQEEQVPEKDVVVTEPQLVHEPEWIDAMAPPEETPPRPLSPSSYFAPEQASSPTGESRRRAMLRGSLVHRLLELLPRHEGEARDRAVARILEVMTSDMLSPADVEKALADAERVMADPALADIFHPDARAEVPVSGLVGTRVVTGIIDRLRITEKTVTLVDFKTGQPPEEKLPPHFLSQMGLYANLLGQIWPGHDIRAGLVFTEDGSIRWCDPGDLAEALEGVCQGS
ncbi:double-strand break repair helicase AddA [Alphaproteobacteria bacterium LSUCC0684]